MSKLNRPAAVDSLTVNRRVQPWLFVGCLCFYILSTSGHIFTPDGVVMFRVTQSLVNSGRASIDDLEIAPGSGTTLAMQIADGTRVNYAKYGLGLSLAAVPTYLLGRLLLPLLNEEQRDLFDIPPTEEARSQSFARDGTIGDQRADFRWLYYDPQVDGGADGVLAFCVAWTNSFIVAGIVLGIFLACRELHYSIRVSLFTAGAAAVATPLWVYAKDFFAEPLAGLAAIWFLYFAMIGRGTNMLRPWLWSGLALGLAPLSKPALLVLVLPAAVLLVGYLRHLPFRDALRRASTVALGFAGMLAIVAIYNYARFGSLLETGYGAEVDQFTTPVVVGVFGLIVSPGRGLLIYFPLWLFLIPAWNCSKGRRLEFLFSIFSLISLVALYATWHQWEGGVCWGPRFLIPAIPLLMIPIASVFEQFALRRATRFVVATLVVVSVVVAFSGTIVNYFEYANWLQWQVRTDPIFAGRGITSAYQLFILRFEYAPILANWTFFRWDYYFVADAIRKPGALLAIYVVFAVGLLLALIQLRAALQFAALSEGTVTTGEQLEA